MTPLFLSVENVLRLQHRTVERHGGLHGLRDAGLLESAVTMPQQKWGGAYLHEGLAAMAAAYQFHLASNHAFLDGNKRIATLAALAFLDLNGVTETPDPDELERVTLEVASGTMSKDALTAWWRAQLGELEP